MNDKKFCEWIRKRECCVCHQGNWNEQLGEWSNTVSHIKTKGSGGKIFGNVVSMCIPCHRAWADGPKKNKELYLELASMQVELFKGTYGE